MRITKERKQENHDRIVAIASQQFRERGFDGVGVAELMERAGLTHGGFYNHFRSKEDLVTQASAMSFGAIAERYSDQDPTAAIDFYISREHRDARGQGCPAAALSCEAARQPHETRIAFGEGIEALIQSLVHGMARNEAAQTEVRAQAVSVLAQAVGAIILSRACPDDAPLADEILDACREDCRSAIARVKLVP